MKKKFTLQYPNGKEIPLDIGKFPGGEVRVRVVETIRDTSTLTLTITAMLFNSDDILILLMLTDAIQRMTPRSHIHVVIPYVPYARQDRVCNEGESFSLKVFTHLINNCHFDSITVYDPHSDVSTRSFCRVSVKVQWKLLLTHDTAYKWIQDSAPNLYLVCPDKGAMDKTKLVFDKIPHFKGIIYAHKVRDPATGNILRTEVTDIPDDISSSHLLIVDDICDGGRTFIELAKVLKLHNPLSMSLYVTHGIFSQGKGVLLKHYPDDIDNNIECTGEFDNVWSTVDFKEYS